MLFSSCFHIFNAKNFTLNKILIRFDYIGVNLITFGSYTPLYVYGYYCYKIYFYVLFFNLIKFSQIIIILLALLNLFVIFIMLTD